MSSHLLGEMVQCVYGIPAQQDLATLKAVTMAIAFKPIRLIQLFPASPLSQACPDDRQCTLDTVRKRAGVKGKRIAIFLLVYAPI